MTETTDVDVLVVGSGLAGLAAAVTAHERGAERVLVAESEDVVGGSTRLSGGVIMGAGTRVQKAAGLEDDGDALFHDYMLLQQWDLEVGIVDRFAHATGETIDWLADLGVHFFDRLITGGGERQPRSHCADGGGQGIIDVLKAECQNRGIDIALGQRVDRLLVADDGAVRGVAVGADELTAHAVVLATGGFGASAELLEEHYPSAVHGDRTWYIGADGARGDGFALGAQVDAQVVGHDRGLRTLAPGWGRINEAMQPGWAVLLDPQGHRFCNEVAPYGILDGLVRARGDRAFILFDDAALRPPPDLADRYRHAFKEEWPNHEPFRTKHYRDDVVDPMVDEGRCHRADTVAELASLLGLDPVVLGGEVERYNAFCAEGRDPDFGKDARFLLPLDTPPFYAAELRPSVVAVTGCGLRIDAQTRVVTATGRSVPNLFAAGECAGGVIGTRYMGSGNGLGQAGTVGRLAGVAAAACVPSA